MSSGLGGVMAAAAEVESFCRGEGWRFCFIGGVAVQRWGMPRFTQDVDLTVVAGLGNEERFVDAVLRRFTGRLKDSRRFALERRVILARTQGGVDLDFSLGAFGFEEGCVERATSWRVSEQVSLTTCSAEDLIIHKAFASRDRDWGDVESVLARQWGKLDLVRVRRELPALLELKEDLESMNKFNRIVATIEARIGKEAE